MPPRVRSVPPPSASPARRFLAEVLHPRAGQDAAARWADRLAAGGIVREIAADPGLRRALPLAADRIGRALPAHALPSDERHALVAVRIAGAASAAAAAATLAPLGRACAEVGVAPLLLKGTALHGDLYPDAALRPVSDADLYVPPARFGDLRAALRRAGLEPDPMTAGRLAAYDATAGRESRLADFVFLRPDARGVHVEAKLDPVQLGLALRLGERFLEGARPSAAYPGFLVPAAEAMAVQQALHLARHDGADLLWFAEIAAVLARAAATFDASRALSLVDGEGLWGTLRSAFRATESLFPGTVPAALRRPGRAPGATPARFRAAPPPCGRSRASEAAATWSLQAAHALSAGRPWEALAALLRRIHPHRAYVAARMGGRFGVVARARRLASAARRAGAA
jgi:hypothetical protein